MPGQVRGHREDVREVHLQRDRRSSRRGGRRASGVVGVATSVAALEGRLEVAPDQRAHLLGAQVVRVVVAGGQHEGAEDDAALHLRAEAAVARLAVNAACRSRAPARAQAVAHAVVAREVARGLGGGDDVVRGDRVRQVGQRDVHDACAPAASSTRSASRNAAIDPGSTPFSRKRPGHADAQAARAPAPRAAAKSGTGSSALVASCGSWPNSTPSQQRGVRARCARTGRPGRATRRTRPGRSG